IVPRLAIPRRDIFSYTNEGAPWIAPQWLAEVLLYLVFRWGGGTALALAKVTVTTAVVGLTAWVGWRRSGSLVLSVGSAIAAAMLCAPFFDIRPDLFFFLGTTVTLAVVEAYRRGARPAVLLLLPVTMALWADLPSSFVYGIGLVGLLAAGELIAAILRRPGHPSRQPRGRGRC